MIDASRPQNNEDSPDDDPQATLQTAYATGDALQCALAHHNFAFQLQDQPQREAELIAHLLAAGVLFFYLQSPFLERAIAALGTCPLEEEQPPSFEAIQRQLDPLPLRDLLPRSLTSDPDAATALAVVWSRARQQRAAHAAAQQDLPDELQQALSSGDRRQLLAALDSLSTEQVQHTLQTLRAAGAIDDQTAGWMLSLRMLDELLREIARSVHDPDVDRSRLLGALQRLQQHGWHLQDAVERIWAGERSEHELTAGLDTHDAELVRRLLTLLSDGT